MNIRQTSAPKRIVIFFPPLPFQAGEMNSREAKKQKFQIFQSTHVLQSLLRTTVIALPIEHVGETLVFCFSPVSRLNFRYNQRANNWQNNTVVPSIYLFKVHHS
jgi:hypothetical protein